MKKLLAIYLGVLSLLSGIAGWVFVRENNWGAGAVFLVGCFLLLMVMSEVITNL